MVSARLRTVVPGCVTEIRATSAARSRRQSRRGGADSTGSDDRVAVSDRRQPMADLSGSMHVGTADSGATAATFIWICAARGSV